VSSAAAPRVSVVTPVYNGERFLAACIESVLRQTFTDFEYIIQDNASEDGTNEIAERFARIDPRVRVVRRKTLLPIIENWNDALSHIHPASEYCKVIHADDLLMPHCLELMVALGDNHPSTSLIAGYRIDGRSVNMTAIDYPITIQPGREIARARLKRQLRDLFGSPSSVMYRAKYVRETRLFYDESNFHADTQVCYELLNRGDYGLVHQVLSFTRRHEETETARTLDLGTRAISHLEIVRKVGPSFFSETEYDELENQQLSRYYRTLASNFLFFRSASFRAHQRDFLRRSGLNLSWTRLLTATLRECVRSVVVLGARLT